MPWCAEPLMNIIRRFVNETNRQKDEQISLHLLLYFGSNAFIIKAVDHLADMICAVKSAKPWGESNSIEHCEGNLEETVKQC